MGSFGIETIISLVLAVLTLIITFIGHYFYVRGKLQKAAAGAITNAEQDDKTGEEKLEIAVDQVYGLVPTSLKVFIHRSSVRKIVQTAFDKIEDYAKKQVEKKSKKKEYDDSSANDNDENSEASESEIIVSPQSNEFVDSEYVATDAALTVETPSKTRSINNNSIQEKIIMENNRTNNTAENEIVTCYEDIGARTEFSKQFKNPKTGQRTAVLFSSPVHYANGTEMTEIDNDFTDGVNDEGEAVYENRKNKFLVRLAKSTAQNKLVELVEGDCRIAMSPVAAITSKINRFANSVRRDIQAVTNVRRDPRVGNGKAELSHGLARFVMKNQEASDIRFVNAIQNCDLEYLVENNRVKENIIVNGKAEAYEYLFNLNLGKLEARTNEKQIELYIPETNEVKYIIPAPYMYDSDGKQSDAVEYLLSGSAGNYTLRVIADETWINAAERRFPVVIDPQIICNNSKIIALHESECNSTKFVYVKGDVMCIGNNNYSNADHEYRAEIALHGDNIRKYFGNDIRITHATIELTKTADARSDKTRGIYVHEDSLTGNIIDRFYYNGGNNRIEIDVTKQMQELIDGKVTDKYLYIECPKIATGVTDYIIIATEKITNPEWKPRILVDFVSSDMAADDSASISVSAGSAGTGSVDLSSGKLRWECPDLAIKHRGVEFNISHVIYDGIAGKLQDTVINKGENTKNTPLFRCGRGAKLNIQQYLLERDMQGYLLGTSDYVYIDALGRHHDFVEKYYYMDPTYGYPHYITLSDCTKDENGDLYYGTNQVRHSIENELGMKMESYRKLLDMAASGTAYTVRYYYFDAEGYKISVDGNSTQKGKFAVRTYADGTTITVDDRIDVREIEQYKQLIKNYDETLNNLELQKVSATQMEDYYYNHWLGIDPNKEGEASTSNAVKLCYAQLSNARFTLQSCKSQIDYYNSERDAAQEKFDAALAAAKKQPVDFIMDNNGGVLGFDYYGKLVMIGSANRGEAVYIVYEDDRIAYVADKDGRIVVSMEYDENDLLSGMTDKYGKHIEYDYGMNGVLASVKRSAESFAAFTYGDNGLFSVSDPSLHKAEIKRSNDRVTYLTEYGDIKKIAASTTTGTNANLKIRSYGITYNSALTAEVKDMITGKKSQYSFDNAGRVVSVHSYKETSDKTADVISYFDRKRTLTCSYKSAETDDLLNIGNLSSNLSGWTRTGSAYGSGTEIIMPNGGTVKYRKYVGDMPKPLKSNTYYIFSATAIAKSWYVVNNRRLSAFGDDVFGRYESDAADEYKRNRTFGMKIRLYGETSLIDEQIASFDNYNSEKQMCCVPICVTDAEKVKYIEIELTYVNNNDQVRFGNLKLFEGKDFSDVQYNDDGAVVLKVTADGFTKYIYEGGKLVRTELTESYESPSVLEYTEYRYDANGALCYIRNADGMCSEFVYDDSGNVIRVDRYHETDPSTKYVNEYEYDEDGNVISALDARGEIGEKPLRTENIIRSGKAAVTRGADMSLTATHYDKNSDLPLGVSGDAFGDGNANVFKYNCGYLTTVTHNGFDISYEYDGRGRLLQTDIAGKPVSRAEYHEHNSYDDDYITDYTHLDELGAQILSLRVATDTDGNTKQVSDLLENKVLQEYEYNDDGTVKSVSDKLADITYNYYYNDGKLYKYIIDAASEKITFEYKYDDDGVITNTATTIAGNQRNYSVDYIAESNTSRKFVKSESLPNKTTLYPTFDALGRLSGTQHTIDGETFMSEDIYYVTRGDRTCDLVASERFGINGELTEQTKYIYDEAGNISEVYENGQLTARYAYDGINRLIREDNMSTGTTAYTYDAGGNILAKNEYAFTLGEIKDKLPLSVKTYTYRSTGWRDQMQSFDGEKCVYDNLGRPTLYRNNTLSWSKYGTLTAFGNNSYTYDVNGVRLTKTVNGITTNYQVNGTKILRSVDNTNEIWYNYGINGIQGITVNGKEYVFRKNVRGDVTHIYKLENRKLSLAAKYKYDAWGKCEVAEIDGSGIGDINPIRYRGYYYDVETGLYYLNSRYYDPETGRFISADDTSFLEPNTVNGLNLYAYCNSNPVMYVDPTGHVVQALLAAAGIIFGTLMGGVFGGLTEMISGGRFIDGFWGGLVNGFISTIGLAAGLALGPAGSAIAGFAGVLGGIVGGIVTEASKTGGKISNEYWKNDFLTNVLPSAAINGLTNALSFGLGNIMGGVNGSSFAARFIDGLKFGAFGFCAPLIVGFPMFAIGLIPIIIVASIQGGRVNGTP